MMKLGIWPEAMSILPCHVWDDVEGALDGLDRHVQSVSGEDPALLREVQDRGSLGRDRPAASEGRGLVPTTVSDLL